MSNPVHIGPPSGVSSEEFERLFKTWIVKWGSRGKGYKVYLRYPLQSRGSSISSGTLEECRSFIKDLVSSESFPEGTLLYITVGGNQGGLYEGYGIEEGKLRKVYRKHPYRLGRSPSPWGSKKVEGLFDDLGISTDELEYKEIMDELWKGE